MKKEPPCDICIPPLMDENKDAFNIYQKCQNQIIMSGSGEAIDLNFHSIGFLLDLYDIQNKRRVFEKVLTVFQHFLQIEKAKPQGQI